MPNNRAPAHLKQNRRPSRAGLEVVKSADEVDVPKPPSGLLKASVAAWDGYWQSVAAQAAEPADLPVVERWVMAVDEWRRALTAVRKQRIVAGSKDQPVLNPLTAWVQSREAEMHRCEAELGIGPKSRLNLGITVGHAAMTVHELNRLTQEDPGASDDDPIEDAEVLAEFEAEAQA